MASYLHPNTSHSPRGNHLEILTMREASRVSYDDQKVAKTEQKAGFKENFNHNSRQNSFDQLWLTCYYVGDSSQGLLIFGIEPNGRSLAFTRTPK